MGSDVDLLVVHRDEPRRGAYALTKQALKIQRLEPHLYTEAEYETARATVDRMVRVGIPLVG